MLSDYFFIGVALVGVAIGTITDLQNRWVPDYVNYFMIAFGLGGHIITSIAYSSFWPIIYSGIAAGIFYAIGSAMYYTGSWGGGDAKMLIGFGALLPIAPITATNLAPWPFLLTLWVNSLLFGALFGILGLVYLAVKNRKKFSTELKILFKENKKVFYVSPVLLILPAAIYFIERSLIFPIIGLLAFFFLFLYFALKSVENACMYKHISPSKLMEGDWIEEKVTVGSFTYTPTKSGVEKKDIAKLVALEKAGKLKQIKIKEGLPYVPAMLAGLVVSIFYGDLMLFLIEKAAKVVLF